MTNLYSTFKCMKLDILAKYIFCERQIIKHVRNFTRKYFLSSGLKLSMLSTFNT